jgi:hypothetical protein
VALGRALKIPLARRRRGATLAPIRRRSRLRNIWNAFGDGAARIGPGIFQL